VRPLVQVHDGVLTDPPRYAWPVRRHSLDPAIWQVVDVVELRYVDAAGRGQPEEELVPWGTPGRRRPPVGLPLADHLADREGNLFPVAEDGGIDEICDRFRVERGVPAGDHDRMVVASVRRLQRNARQV